MRKGEKGERGEKLRQIQLAERPSGVVRTPGGSGERGGDGWTREETVREASRIVSERGIEWDRGERRREKKRESVCVRVCVCVCDTMRDRGLRETKREREREWLGGRERGGRAGGREVITLATLTRRRPDRAALARLASARDSDSPTYTPTLGLPLHLLSLFIPLVPLRHSGHLLFRPPTSLPFLRLPFLSSWFSYILVFLVVLRAERFIRVHFSIAEPESINTRERERRNERD